MPTRTIGRDDSSYPKDLPNRIAGVAPRALYTIGDVAILSNHLVGLLCSVQCPGSVIIKAFDAIRALRDAGVVFVGGFHSPMEQDCLDILLRGCQPVVLCPAKGLAYLRLGTAVRGAVDEGRMLVLSCFDQSAGRSTVIQAIQRNNMVAALSSAVLVPYAAPGGKTWSTVLHALDQNRQVFTFDDDNNTELISAGAMPVTPSSIADAVRAVFEPNAAR